MKTSEPRQKNTTRAKPPKTTPDAALSERIIAAGQQHFFAHGFRAITTDDLADELGISKKTLYALFPSKEALLEAVVNKKFGNAEADAARITGDPSLGCVAKLHELLACLQHHMAEIQPAFVRDMQRGAPEVFAMIERRRAGVIREHFGKVFEESRRAGVIRKDVPTALLIAVILGAVNEVVNPVKLAELGLQPREGLMCILRIIFEGAMTARGRAKL